MVEGLDTIGSNHDGAAFTHQDGKFVLFSGKGGKCIRLVSVELFSFYFMGSKLVRFLDKFEHSMLVNRHNPDHQNVPKQCYDNNLLNLFFFNQIFSFKNIGIS